MKKTKIINAWMIGDKDGQIYPDIYWKKRDVIRQWKEWTGNKIIRVKLFVYLS